jgi:hypothetical protein
MISIIPRRARRIWRRAGHRRRRRRLRRGHGRAEGGRRQGEGGRHAAQVKTKVGAPDSRQEFRNADLQGGESRSSCWYWGMDLQVCFDDGKVSSVNDYGAEGDG